MKNSIKAPSLLLLSFIVAPLVLARPGAVQAKSAPSNKTVIAGNDVSYPQCSKTLPTGQAFGIVGVNAGLANTTNPCLATQLVWAEKSTGLANAEGGVQPKVSLYVNTANPGGLNTASWPSSNIDPLGTTSPNPYGICDHSNSTACAWQYGWNRAVEDAWLRGISNPSSYNWWLDVEIANTWDTTLGGIVRNNADLEGMAHYFKSIGTKVGIYSTSYQWGIIAGLTGITSPLSGLNNWIPGATSSRGAIANCNLKSFTNGKVAITQWVSNKLDYDYACP